MPQSHNPEDLLVLKISEYQPGFRWTYRPDSGYALQFGPHPVNARRQRRDHESRRVIGAALREFSDLARRAGEGIDDDDLMTASLLLINKYGPLYGTPNGERPRDGQFLRDTPPVWKCELLLFLDVLDAADAIRDRDLAKDLVQRISVPANGTVIQFTRRIGDPILLAETTGRQIEEDELTGSRREIAIAERAEVGNPRDRAQQCFITMVYEKLYGALKLSLTPMVLTRAEISPIGLLGTIYARLWMDVAGNAGKVQTRRRCLNCHKPLPVTEDGRSTRKYCADGGKCRKADSRRRARQAAIA